MYTTIPPQERTSLFEGRVHLVFLLSIFFHLTLPSEKKVNDIIFHCHKLFSYIWFIGCIKHNNHSISRRLHGYEHSIYNTAYSLSSNKRKKVFIIHNAVKDFLEAFNYIHNKSISLFHLLILDYMSARTIDLLRIISLFGGEASSESCS